MALLMVLSKYQKVLLIRWGLPLLITHKVYSKKICRLVCYFGVREFLMQEPGPALPCRCSISVNSGRWLRSKAGINWGRLGALIERWHLMKGRTIIIISNARTIRPGKMIFIIFDGKRTIVAGTGPWKCVRSYDYAFAGFLCVRQSFDGLNCWCHYWL